MLRIALSGKMAGGKTTISSFLVNQLGFTRVSVASTLKELAFAAKLDVVVRQTLAADLLSRLFPNAPATATVAFESYEQLCVELADELTAEEKPRQFLQRLGTDVCRALDEDVWVRDLVARVEQMQGEVVCDDVRFPNEVAILKQHGWKTVRCDIPEPDRLARVVRLYGEGSLQLQEHESETALDTYQGWDYLIPTNVPMADQPAEVLKMLEVFRA